MGPMLMMEWNGIQNLMWERKYPVAMMLTNSMVVKYVVAQVPQDVHDAKPSNTGQSQTFLCFFNLCHVIITHDRSRGLINTRLF